MAKSENFRPLFKDFVEPDLRVLTVSLWHFHDYLNAAVATGEVPADEILERVARRDYIDGLEDLTCRKIYAAVEDDTIKQQWLDSQVGAAARLVHTPYFDNVRERDQWIAEWAVPHARALAAVAGFTGRMQDGPIREFATGVTLVRRLVALPRDLQRGINIVPLDQAKAEGLTFHDLRTGITDHRVRRLLWKETIRARDALAQSQSLMDPLSRSQAHVFRRWLLTALELLVIIERRRFDVWSRPVSISGYARLHIDWQSLFGRAAFKR